MDSLWGLSVRLSIYPIPAVFQGPCGSNVARVLLSFNQLGVHTSTLLARLLEDPNRCFLGTGLVTRKHLSNRVQVEVPDSAGGSSWLLPESPSSVPMHSLGSSTAWGTRNARGGRLWRGAGQRGSKRPQVFGRRREQTRPLRTSPSPPEIETQLHDTCCESKPHDTQLHDTA